jgi:serine/threonine protein kinase
MIPFLHLWKGNAAPPGPTATDPPPSSRPPRPDSLTAGSIIGRCVLLRQLGEGVCGRVFQAHHKTLNISVALKLLQPALFNDPRVHEQIKHEAQLLARLNHPHIVRVWDFEDDPSCPYIMMEYIDGPSLADLIEQCGRLAPDRAIQLMRHVARGLNAAWKLGIIHRDLKPANILLTRNGEAKLSDLGLAVILGSSPNAVRPVAAGTPLYAAPEQCYAPQTVDQRSDLYSLGATFYHALTGAPPFAGPSVGEVMHQHACEIAVPPHHRVPGLPGGLSAIILRLLAKEPAHRYGDYEELLIALDGQTDGGGVDRQRARPTGIAPRLKLEDLLSTQAYVGQDPARPSDVKPGDDATQGNRKQTMIARRLVVPTESADPPRVPSQAPEMTQGIYPGSLNATPIEGSSSPADRTPASTPTANGPLEEGIAAARAGRVVEAVALLREVTLREPGNETAWLWLARSVGPGAEAVSIYQRLRQTNPDNLTARQGLLGARLAAAAADARAGNRTAARAALQELTREFPDLEEAWVGLARLADTPAEADQLWRNVLRMNPARAEARLALARRGRR